MENYIQKAINGDLEAIAQLLEKDEEILYKVAYSYMKNEQDSLDVMQELTYKAFKKFHTIKQPEYARTWLIKVLINCCKDAQKKKLLYVELHEFTTTYVDKPSEISSLLETLSLTEQQLVYAKYFLQLQNHEIAKLNNIPEGTVKSRLHHVLKKLRKRAGVKEDWF